MEKKEQSSQLILPEKISVNLGTKQTQDYSIFKLKDRNREIKRVHLEKLEESISSNDRLEWKPILVNEQMEVIDGQHRLKVAEKLKKPIYYQVVKGETHADLNNLQVSLAWSLHDHFHSWYKAGYPSYVKLSHFMMKHNLDVGKVLCLFGQYKDKNFYDSFRKGNFDFNIEVEVLNEKVARIKWLIDTVSIKTTGSKRYLHSTNFWCAFSVFLNNKDMEYDIFQQKLEYKLEFMRPATRVQEYLIIFKNIYNWKNKAPIE